MRAISSLICGMLHGVIRGCEALITGSVINIYKPISMNSRFASIWARSRMQCNTAGPRGLEVVSAFGEANHGKRVIGFGELEKVKNGRDFLWILVSWVMLRGWKRG